MTRRSRSHVGALALALGCLVTGCSVSWGVDPEGYRCEADGSCPEGFSCQQGVCRAGAVDPSCTSLVCEDGAPVCVGAQVLRRSIGRCKRGACVFDSVDSTCATSCSNGACLDTCASVSCVEPPPAACVDVMTLRTFEPVGTCADGACSYPARDQVCANGCELGQCKGVDLCVLNGVVCQTPPAARCEGNSQRTFAATGTCAPGTGQCTYPAVDLPCANGCALGACLTKSLTFGQTGPRLRFAINALDVAPSSGGASAVAVGDRGALAKWDGTTWTELSTGSTKTLRAVAFVSSGAAYAVGDEGTAFVVRPATNQVTAAPIPSTTASLVAVSGRSETEVLVASSTGSVLRQRSGAWTTSALPSPPFRVTGAFLDESLRERVVGSCGSPSARCVAYRSLAGPMPTYSVQTQAGSTFSAVGGGFTVPTSTTASVAVVGLPDETLVTHDTTGFATGTYFASLSTSTALLGESVVGVTAQATPLGLYREVYVLTGSALPSVNGRLYRLSRSLTGASVTEALVLRWGEGHLSVNESTGVLVADVRRALNRNTVFRRGIAIDEALELGEDFAGASIADDGTVVMATLQGDVAARATGSSTASLRRGAGDVVIDALEAGHGTEVLLAGRRLAGGAVLMRTSGFSGFTTMFSAASGVLHAVCRVSDLEGWAVGDGAMVVRIQSGAATTMTVPTSANLLAVDCSAGRAVACGGQGTVLVYENGAWSSLPQVPQAPTVRACRWVDGRVIVGGDGFLYRSTPSGWTTQTPRPGLTSLIVRGPQELYGVSTSAARNESEVARFDGERWTSLLTVSGLLGGGGQTTTGVVWGGTLGLLVEGR